MSILEQSHELRNSIHLYSFTSSLVYIYIYIYIYTYITNIRMAVRSSIVVIYILGGFNVFGVMYINLNPKELVVASEF